jgi:hypothetical protein
MVFATTESPPTPLAIKAGGWPDEEEGHRMELRLEDDPTNCGKLRPCPKIWGTDDPAEVLDQGRRPSPAQRDRLVLPDDDVVVSYPASGTTRLGRPSARRAVGVIDPDDLMEAFDDWRRFSFRLEALDQ